MAVAAAPQREARALGRELRHVPPATIYRQRTSAAIRTFAAQAPADV